ncbi:MAG TPA: polysaccharide biosynthesis tyrosine autokinase [Pyrinomonadaceae bacterium]|jgi:capsular exopolysaccharide synthesis family protein|nr:polysaccharide biosynthesis tyrosine autokinase [Pyrinomonadaceae bacterium]
MSKNTQLVKKPDRVADGDVPLDRPVPFYPSSRYDAYPGEVSSGYNRLHEYWSSVRNHFLLVIGIVVLVTAITTVYMARQPDVYESLSRVQVDLETANNPAIGALKGNSIFLNTPLQDPTYFNTQITILTSAGLLGRVAKTLDLEHNEAFLRPQSTQKRSLWESLKRVAGYGTNPAPSKPLEDNKLRPSSALARDDVVEANHYEPYVEVLQSQLSVKQLNDTRIIEISFRHQDPEIAEKINNMVAETFVLSNLERKTETSNTAGDFLQKRIADLQSEIRHGEEQLINYAKSHQILSLDASQNTVVDRLTGLNKQLLEAENDRKTAESAFRAVLAPGALEAQAEASNNAVVNNSGAATETKIAELKQRRAQLLLEYTEKYPEVRDLNQQIAMLEKQSGELRTRTQSVVRTNLETRYRQALQKEQSLKDAFQKQRGETLTQNEAAVNYRIIQQEIETNKTLLDGLLQRSKENDVILAGTPNNIHVVDHAARPKIPVGPKRRQAIALAAMFSLILGIALARYLDYLDDSVHSSEDVENFLRLPALAVIPSLGSFTRRRLLSAMPGGNKKNGNHNGEELLLNSSQRSSLAESYRQLRTSVLLSSAGGAPKTLLVTSSQPGEGKTTTVVNIATTLSQTGAKVVIIDADMRRPRVHSIFNLDNSNGLSDILSSRMSEAEMLALVQPHQESGLHVITSGRIPPNPAELLGSEQLRTLINVLQKHFAHVVIDSPPAASFTDGVLLAAVVDGVLLVVHGGSASRHIVRRTKQLLADVGAKILGVVLNNVTLSRQDYYYNRNYDRNYYANPEVEPERKPNSLLG